jgi:hypothetical protein
MPPVAIASTTIPVALDTIVTRIPLTAATGVVRGWLLVCEGECMLVQGAVAGSTTTFQCLRGWDGTAVVPHKINAPVLVGPKSHFANMFDRSGAFVAAGEVATPSVNIPGGNHFVDSSGTFDQTVLVGNIL